MIRRHYPAPGPRPHRGTSQQSMTQQLGWSRTMVYRTKLCFHSSQAAPGERASHHCWAFGHWDVGKFQHWIGWSSSIPIDDDHSGLVRGTPMAMDNHHMNHAGSYPSGWFPNPATDPTGDSRFFFCKNHTHFYNLLHTLWFEIHLHSDGTPTKNEYFETKNTRWCEHLCISFPKYI